ncbi:FAD-binding domain [Mycobacteroides chelonae]|uniref:FAD-binding domain n=1 Tax=Mycobacteroides chelonae TaxID=1774 RepID=UPI001E4CB899|nr:FAD-binding domain [Mycobacteroides chelonae]
MPVEMPHGRQGLVWAVAALFIDLRREYRWLMPTVAIIGAGIGGPTLAYWLLKYGYEPTLIEKAPAPRTGGYIIDFWGGGYQVAERMGLGNELRYSGYFIERLKLANQHGRSVGGFPIEPLRQAADNRLVTIPRGDLAAMIYRQIEGKVEALFGDSITAVQQDTRCAHVTLTSGPTRDFDLVIGAGGIHSPVRNLAFGPPAAFEKDLGYYVATFETRNYSQRDDDTYLAYGTPGRTVARFTMRDNRTLFFLIFRADLVEGHHPGTTAEAKALVRQVFGDAGWECPHILHSMDQCDEIYFDRVMQTVMGRWSHGRIALLGDAAAAVSLLAGEGAGLAMIEAYVLAGELHRAGGDHRAAFHRYEHFLRDFVEQKQQAARRMATVFVPKTSLGLWTRNYATRLLNIAPLAERLVRQQLNDNIELPDYISAAA